MVTNWTGMARPADDGFAGAAQSRLRKILDQFNRLHDLGGLQDEGIHVPAVVVVGEQSHGKSTVLSRILNINLPSKSGMCTRIPLLVELRDNKESAGPDQVLSFRWPASRGGQGNQRSNVTEEEIPGLIEDATQELAGPGYAISTTPATLTVMRRGEPDLNLFDLPGLLAVAGRGAPDGICDDIRNLVKKYAAPKESIMLVVMPAESDTQIHHSLALAKELDRDGQRTLGVLTKCDKAQPVTLAESVQRNVSEIKLGYALLRNPETREGQRINFEKSEQDEREFFSENASTLGRLQPANTLGIEALVQTLVKLQGKIIDEQLPEMRRKIQQKLEERTRQRSALSDVVTTNEEACRRFNKIIEARSKRLEKLYNLDVDEFISDRPEISNGPAVNMHYLRFLREEFSNKLPMELARSVPSAAILGNDVGERMRDAVRNQVPIGLEGMVERLPFRRHLKEFIEKCQAACRTVLSGLRGELERVALKALADSFPSATAFPVLLRHLEELQRAALLQAEVDCQRFIERCMTKEMDIPFGFTNNPLYKSLLGRLRSVAGINQGQIATTPGPTVDLSDLGLPAAELQAYVEQLRSSRLDNATKNLQIDLFAYWFVVSQRLLDVIPLELCYSFKCAMLEDFRSAAMGLANDAEGLKGMMQDPRLAEEHARLSARIKELNTALEMLSYQ